MRIAKPLVLVGTGRCGSTLLHDLLSRHSELAYLTPLCARLPARPALNAAAMRVTSRAPWTRRIPGVRRGLVPSEAYPFWERICPGFSEPCRDLVDEDLTPPVADAARSALARTFDPARSRLLLKVTGWPRVGFLDALLDDARFVHVRRDGRAVATSWLATSWWGGWGGPDRWRWGALSDDQQARWKATDRSFVALAALNWEILMNAFAVAGKQVPEDRLLDVTYEELCARPVEVVRQVLGFAELDADASLERHVANRAIRDANAAWRDRLTPHQQEVLLRTIEPALARHGYA